MDTVMSQYLILFFLPLLILLSFYLGKSRKTELYNTYCRIPLDKKRICIEYEKITGVDIITLGAFLKKYILVFVPFSGVNSGTFWLQSYYVLIRTSSRYKMLLLTESEPELLAEQLKSRLNG
jgi:hypothetical protein